MVTDPSATTRRTPLQRVLQGFGTEWRAYGDGAIAWAAAGGTDSRQLAIADLSPLPRLGFKGRGTIAAMQKRGVTVEATPNRAFRQPDGSLCLVLAPGEVVLLGALDSDPTHFDVMLEGWRLEDEERTYPVLRRESHAWLALTGAQVPTMMAKLCGIDLRRDRLADLAIAQTTVAKMTAIVTRADAGNLPLYHLLADTASAVYLCTCLLDAAREFGGGWIGISQLRHQGEQ